MEAGVGAGVGVGAGDVAGGGVGVDPVPDELPVLPPPPPPHALNNATPNMINPLTAMLMKRMQRLLQKFPAELAVLRIGL